MLLPTGLAHIEQDGRVTCQEGCVVTKIGVATHRVTSHVRFPIVFAYPQTAGRTVSVVDINEFTKDVVSFNNGSNAHPGSEIDVEIFRKVTL